MKIKIICLLVSLLCFTISSGQRSRDRIFTDKDSKTESSPYSNDKSTSSESRRQNPTPLYARAKHENIIQDEHLELRYTVRKTGESSKNNFYSITGHIFNELGEQLYGHNPRIVQFQIENWDSGFLNDNLQSIDGFTTTDKLNTGSPLYAFGNDVVREFQFEFKTKKDKQPYVKARIIKDWSSFEKYEAYLLIDFASLSGTWLIDNNTEISFELQFSPQGDQINMKDLYEQEVIWVRSTTQENTYIRVVGTPPSTPSASSDEIEDQQGKEDINSGSNYPSGGYLGQNNSNQSNETERNPAEGNDDYPEGGYLGGSKVNSKNTNNSGGRQQRNGSYLGNQKAGTDKKTQAYSSAIQVIDRNTLKYANSEGISVMLTKERN